MNEAFYELPKEKQQAIDNAAMEVFGEYEYKRASTDLIASKAGVSKGLLFYYFHNKKSLYMHTFEYATEIVKEQVSDTHLFEITDFFELIAYATKKKVKMLTENPYIMQFTMRSFYSQKEEVSGELQTSINDNVDKMYEVYFKNLEMEKFKAEIDPKQILKMLIWMTDGYLHTCQMEGKAIEIDDVDRAFTQWTNLFKQISYKEEYL